MRPVPAETRRDGALRHAAFPARRPRRDGSTARPHALVLAALIATLAPNSGCSHAVSALNAGTASAPVADSATVALWRMDEPGGFDVADEGPFRLNARAGADTDTDFGRFRGARTFQRSIDSFLLVPFSTALEAGGELTVEAWIEPHSLGNAELAPIVERWTPQANEQSWLLGIVGLNLGGVGDTPASPGYLQQLVEMGSAGRLVFALQPAEAGLPVSYFSTTEIELDRWTHVAVTFDGHEVRFYLDGRLDAQFAFGSGIRASQAPLMVGNWFDPRWITDLGDRPRVGAGVDRNAFYSFEGSIDELRISRVARREFWPAR